MLALPRYWLSIATLAVCVGPTAYAQGQPVTTAPLAEGKPAPTTTLSPYLKFDRVVGMAKGGVTAITQDPNGFLWFGTEEGLSRYDGYEFLSFVSRPDEKNPLSSYTITALAADKDGLWIGTDNGLDRMDYATHKVTVFHAKSDDPKAIASDAISSLALDGHGTLWIGTADAGVDALSPASGDVKHYTAKQGLADDAIAVVFADGTGRIWIGTKESGLNVLDPASGKVARYNHDPEQKGTLGNDQIQSVAQDANGAVWVGTADGVSRMDPGAKAFTSYLHDEENPKVVASIVEGADQGLWLGVKGLGLMRFDPKSGAIETYTHESSDTTTISNPWPLCSFSDRGGVLWFGFEAGGASKLLPIRRDFVYYRTEPVFAFFEDGDRVWLGGIGLRSFDFKTGNLQEHLVEELAGAHTTAILGDAGWLWIGTAERGVVHFQPSTGKVEILDVESGKMPSDGVLALLRDTDYLWVGTYDSGVVRMNLASGEIIAFKNDPKNETTLSSNDVLALHEDKAHPGTLWVGTAGGLNALDIKTGKVVRYVHNPANPTSISHDHVTTIHADQAGQLWVGTLGGGLDRFDTKTGAFSAIHVTDGLPTEVLYGILEDKAGNLWIPSTDGLAELDPKTKRIVTFRGNDGLQDDEFGQGGYYAGASGRFYVGGPHGFNAFFPDRVKPDAHVPPVVITQLDVMGASRAIPGKLSLGYRDRWFSIEFSALSYAAPERNRYRYRLVGFSDWIETNRRYVSYSSLPPGSYTFEVQGSNEHGVWNTTSTRLPLRIAPPPWRTWWAYTAYGVVALLLALLFVRRQRMQIAELNRAHRLTELEREMALTSAVQEGFFPAERSVRDNLFKLESFYRAAAECGGDWWSYELRDDTYMILVGDATGHGAGSAMVTAAAASTFRSLGRIVDDDTRLRAMSDEVLRVSRGQYHMTLTAVELNVKNGAYIVRSAGGLPVFTLPPTGRPKLLMCPGTPLGSENFEVGNLEGKLLPGERLLILTDGIPEVALANKKLLGPRGVANFYMQTREQELEHALVALVKKVEEVQANIQDDDWTAVMVQWGTPLPVEQMDADTQLRGTKTIRRAS